MSRIRDKDTGPEMIVRRTAHRLGLRFRLYDKRLPGRPDLSFPKWRTAIFVNGCFWHHHAGCRRGTTPKSNTDFWADKLRANVARDNANYARLTDMGWRPLVLWECECRSAPFAENKLRDWFSNQSN